MASIDGIAYETRLELSRAQSRAPVYIILGTAGCIAQNLADLTIVENLHDNAECIILPPLVKGTDNSKNAVKALYDLVKHIEPPSGGGSRPWPGVRIRPVRAIYVHDMNQADTQDDTQNQQLDFAVGLTGRDHDKVVRLVRYGPPPPATTRIERIRKRWRRVFLKVHTRWSSIPAEREARDRGQFRDGVLASLVELRNDETELVRFVKDLKLLGDVEKTDLWKRVC